MGACPRGIELDSHAFLFSGFGTHEIVKYYDVVRELLWACHDSARERVHSESLARGDFLAAEVPRLKRVRDEWLASPDPECHGLTPRQIIEQERARLPQGMSGKDAMIDDGCPLCQMMADGLHGPMFWHLDGCNMDDDFAFSFERTREEFDERAREREEWDRRWRAEQGERERLEVKYPGGGYGDPDSVWKRSFVADSENEPLPLRLFGIGTFLSELIVDLKGPPEDRPLIDQLSRDFGNLREVAQSGDLSLAEALFEPVLDRFCETLNSVAASHSELEPKCADLQQRLRRFCEPPRERDESSPRFDDDIPF
jgi:hypothetical protein